MQQSKGRTAIAINGKLTDDKTFLVEFVHQRQALPELLLDGLVGHR
ncbi:hypothetical protein [Candidatus Williamhamiltonella defendens]|nr:hypothetical protein [Candidatus Hamiltonella defensa]